VRDRQEAATQVHQDNSTPSNFKKLKPSSMVGKGAELVENVGEAAGKVVDGLKGDAPGQYVMDTLKGRKQ
jgi:hypothetical protein